MSCFTCCRCEPTYEELKLFVFYFFYATIFCCEPTYEELKPKKRRKLSLVILCCEPTYEELKPNSVLEFYNRGWSCEPTYEELKQQLLEKEKEDRNKLRAYLWGIETALRLQFFYRSF